MQEIAVYGKGGIGKSTISANLSAALSLLNQRVLQVGCDPKQDSTRLLLRGQVAFTVLDYLKVTNPLKYRQEDILFEGFNGVHCLEAGGPEPGVGCAGRGILSTFELLNTLKIKENGYDVILYDVLGDVVCGGFAVPIRREYAESIYIVTSGEYMSLYAANNILRGIKNYDGQEKRVAGVIFNRRNIKDEEERVARWTQAVKLPICAEFPRSDEFALAEEKGQTLVEYCPSSSLGEKFMELAQRVLDKPLLHAAQPLSDEDLERIVLGIQSPKAKKMSTPPGIKSAKPSSKESLSPYWSKNIVSQEPLHGCAFNGAITMAIHIQDGVVIGHGPKSCSHISYQSISSAGRRKLWEKGVLLPVQLAPNLQSTYMDETVMVFGGMELLQEKIREVKKQKPRVIVVVSSCPAGIIGDHIEQTASFSEENMPIIPIRADGNLAGDYLQGMIMAYTGIARVLIKKGVPQLPDRVNIIFEKVVATNTPENFRVIQGLLQRLGITVHCRYLCETNTEKVKTFLAAPLNLLANKDYMGRMMEQFFREEFGARFFDLPFPIGFSETKEWVTRLAAHFRKEELVADILIDHERMYRQELAQLKPILKGKKLMVITYNHQLDWLLEIALDLEMEIVQVGILNFSQDTTFTTRFQGLFPVLENYDQGERVRDIEKLKPDLLLANYSSSAQGEVLADTIPYCPDVGFFAGLYLARRWAGLFQFKMKEEWRSDEQLFRKYHG